MRTSGKMVESPSHGIMADDFALRYVLTYPVKGTVDVSQAMFVLLLNYLQDCMLNNNKILFLRKHRVYKFFHCHNAKINLYRSKAFH